jgi:hypothetical protein
MGEMVNNIGIQTLNENLGLIDHLTIDLAETKRLTYELGIAASGCYPQDISYIDTVILGCVTNVNLIQIMGENPEPYAYL